MQFYCDPFWYHVCPIRQNRERYKMLPQGRHTQVSTRIWGCVEAGSSTDAEGPSPPATAAAAAAAGDFRLSFARASCHTLTSHPTHTHTECTGSSGVCVIPIKGSGTMKEKYWVDPSTLFWSREVWACGTLSLTCRGASDSLRRKTLLSAALGKCRMWEDAELSAQVSWNTPQREQR